MRLKDLYFKYIANDPKRKELSILDAQPEPEIQVPFLTRFDCAYYGIPYPPDSNDL